MSASQQSIKKSGLFDSRLLSNIQGLPWTGILTLGAFFVISFAAYWSILNNGPVADDWGLFYKVAYIPSWHLWRLFLTQSPLFIRPIPFFMVWLFYHLFGLDLMPSHLLNVGVHTINAFLLMWMLQQVGVGRRTGLFAASLFLLTPIGAESVSWTTGRFDVWALFFMLLAAGLYTSYLKNNKCKLYIFALIAVVAAWLSKEPSIIMVGIIPALELLFLIIPNRNSQPNLQSSRSDRLKPAVYRVGLLFALFAGYIVMRYAIMGRLGGATYIPLFGKPHLKAAAHTFVTLLAPLDKLQSSNGAIELLAGYIGCLYALSLGLVIWRWKHSSDGARRAWLFLVAFLATSFVPIYYYAFMTGMTNYLTDSRMYYITYATFISLMVIGLYEFGWNSSIWKIFISAALVAIVPIFIIGLNHNNRVWERAATISSIIIRETKAQLPDPPQKARLYFENTPRLEGAHIMASALKEEVQLSYGRRDLRIFYVNPDPALEEGYFKNMATQDANGYLFSFNWHKTQLLLLRGPLRLQTN